MNDEKKKKRELIEELSLLRERVSHLEAVDLERRKAEKRKNAFVELGERLTAAVSRKEAAQVIVDVAFDLFGWDCCYIVLYFEENHIVLPLLIIDTVDGERVEFEESYITSPPGPIVSSVIEEGGRLILRDGASPIKDPYKPFGNASRLSLSLMSVPIRKGRKVVGALSIQSYSPNLYAESDLHILQSLGDLCGGALERIHAEESLKRAHEIYRDAIANAKGVPYYFNYDNQRYDYIGDGCEELFEIQRKDFTFDHLKRIMKDIVITDPDISYSPLEYFDAFKRGEVQKYRVDLRILTHNHKERWISDCCVPIINEETNAVIGSLGIFQDISDRKKTEETLKQSFDKLRSVTEGAINAISKIVEIRDPYTSGHQQRVAQLACLIARKMGLSEEQIDAIHTSAVIHDIGKIYVPSEILSSPRRLTDVEYYILKTHSEVGYDILKSIEFPWPVAMIVLQHHERINGSGYPSGLKGEETMIEARIISVADVIEAMAYHRPYRPGLSIETALIEIEENKGTLYDCDASDICLSLFREKGFAFE